MSSTSKDVSSEGLESSPVTESLAGLRANEARYFKNKYDHVFAVDPASEATKTIDWVSGILKDERDIVIASVPLEATEFVVGGHSVRVRVLRVRALDQRDVRDRGRERSAQSGSSCPKGWRFPRSSRRGSSSRGRSRSWPGRSEARTS